MPLVWCALLFLLFIACLLRFPGSGSRIRAGTFAFLLALIGIRPWIQVVFFGLAWMLDRLILQIYAWIKQQNEAITDS